LLELSDFALRICLFVSTIAFFAASGMAVSIPTFFANSYCKEIVDVTVFLQALNHSSCTPVNDWAYCGRLLSVFSKYFSAFCLQTSKMLSDDRV